MTHIPFAHFRKENTILLSGFSKGYAMTGWRIGYAAGPSEIVSAMCKIHQYTMLCAPIMSQKAALAALAGNTDSEMRDSYKRRRMLITEGLNSIGLTCLLPDGAFYVFCSVKNTGLSSFDFAEKLLFSQKVAVVPGNVFGECGEGYIRCSYATSEDRIEEALIRMERFLKSLR
jgi:aminotransferase